MPRVTACTSFYGVIRDRTVELVSLQCRKGTEEATSVARRVWKRFAIVWTERWLLDRSAHASMVRTSLMTATMSYLLPTPDEEGIAKTQELYLNRIGKTLTNEEAAEVLGRAMRYLFLINHPCSTSPSTLESPMTTP